MTPAVVTQLIKQGINPLEMKISDLNRVAEQVRSEVGKMIIRSSVSIYINWKK